MSGLNNSAKHDLDSVCCSIKPPTEQAHQQTIQHPKLLLVNEVSSCVDLSQGQFEVVFVIQYVDKVSIEWVYILNKNKQITTEPPHDKTNKMACAPSEDSDQPWHPSSPISLRCLPEETLGP